MCFYVDHEGIDSQSKMYIEDLHIDKTQRSIILHKTLKTISNT